MRARGFVGGEMLVRGAADSFPVLGLLAVLAAAFVLVGFGLAPGGLAHILARVGMGILGRPTLGPLALAVLSVP